MTNDQVPMTKEIPSTNAQELARQLVLGNWVFIGHWHLVIGHSQTM
jgi:hypothetical protein